MLTLTAQLVGIAAFFVVTVVLGIAIRRDPTKDAAQRLSRISHTFFWLSLVPLYAGVIIPGLTHFDELLGISALPFPIARWILGVPMALAGLFYSVASMRALKNLGSGSMAFKLTKMVVAKDVYERVRNPMSLGLYLQFTAVSLLAGSTTLLLVVVLYTAAHAFNLRFFEERELSARYGASYDEYRARVPFLIPRFG
ncbi:MAG: isoprenylcysteine carboxylmethyltransferase family protein [Archangium sp.]